MTRAEDERSVSGSDEAGAIELVEPLPRGWHGHEVVGPLAGFLSVPVALWYLAAFLMT